MQLHHSANYVENLFVESFSLDTQFYVNSVKLKVNCKKLIEKRDKIQFNLNKRCCEIKVKQEILSTIKATQTK